MPKRPRLETTDCEPRCIKEADLGRLDARIENNERNGIEIKETLQRIVENHEKDKQDTSAQFSAMTAELAKLGATMQQTADSNKELLTNQNNLIQKIQQMLLDNQNIINKQTNISIEVDKQSEIHEERYAKIKSSIVSLSDRLTKLEQHKNTLVCLGSLCISILAAVGVVVQIYQSLHK